MSFVEREKDEGLAAHLLRNVDALGMSTELRSRLQMAYRLSQGTRADKALGGRMAVEVRDQVQGVVEDVAAAATQRGERVSRFNDAGARRVRDRDGLGALADRGSISADDLRIGMAYRLLFEHGSGYSIGSQLAGDKVQVKAATSDNVVAAGLLRAYAGVRLTGCDKAVMQADKTGRALRILRAVAGEGRSLRSLGRGDGMPLNLAALIRALQTAGVALAANGGLRIKGR